MNKRQIYLAAAVVLAAALTTYSQEPPAEKKPKRFNPAGDERDLEVRTLTDRVIMLAIEKELLASQAVDSHLIDVRVEDGIVTLSGSISNLLANQIAIGLAQRVRGVMSVVDQIEVNPLERSDGDLQKDIQAALAADPATRKLKPKVEVTDAVATLTGEVPSYGKKTLASRVTSAVKGIVELNNNLEIAGQDELSDADLQKEISELFRFAVLLDNAKIDVDVENGNAVLSGAVSSAFQRSRAAQLALQAGAKDVDTRGIRVNWRRSHGMLREERYENATDEQIQAAVERALQYDPRVLSFEPHVAVEKGVVTLTGNVDHLTAKMAAERVARYTIGVRRVKNFLHVRPPVVAPEDAEIERFTREALRRDPYIDHQDIVIECENAHVGLYGLVDNPFERQHAEWTASRQLGVVHVDNYLTVRAKWKPKSDAAIESDLKERLAMIFTDEDNQVTVKVSNGVALLEGEVDTRFMWQSALEQAIAAGAREPHMSVRVRYGIPGGQGYDGPYYFLPLYGPDHRDSSRESNLQ